MVDFKKIAYICTQNFNLDKAGQKKLNLNLTCKILFNNKKNAVDG